MSKEFEVPIRIPPNPECSLNPEQQQQFFIACSEALESKRKILSSFNENLRQDDGGNHYDDSNVDMSGPNQMHNLLASRTPSLDRMTISLQIVLEKLSRGTYNNHCESCQQPIPFARLLAVPHTRHCMKCKQG